MPRLRYLTLFVLASACSVQRTPPVSTANAVDDHTAHMQVEDRMAPAPVADAVSMLASQDPSLPASNATAAARLAASPRHGEWVKIATTPGSADSIMAWIVYPKASGKAPVVVVVHEIFGLSTWVRAVADQAAAEGFIAIAPDFLSRVRGGPSSVELPSGEATRLINGVNSTERNTIIAAAANYAMMQPSAQQKYAVFGYCWGGGTTWMHAINGGLKGFKGGVAYYGLPYLKPGTPATATTAAVPATIDTDSLARIKTPIMLLNGAGDARIGAAMPALDSLMRSLKKEYTGINYPGAIHGFLRAQNDTRAPRAASATRPTAETQEAVDAELAANLAATKDAWPKTVEFLKRVLK